MSVDSRLPLGYSARRGPEGFQIIQPDGSMLCDGMGSREVSLFAALLNRIASSEEYLHDICDALKSWKALVDHAPKGESEDFDAEVGMRFDNLIELIEVADDARDEP